MFFSRKIHSVALIFAAFASDVHGFTCGDETCDSVELARSSSLLQKGVHSTKMEVVDAPALEHEGKLGHTQVFVPQLFANGTYIIPTKAKHMSQMQRKVAAKHGTGIPDEMQEVLDLHNLYRCMHGVEAMTWDETIAANAQRWVGRGQYGHSTSESRQLPSIGYVGENLAWGYPERSGVDSTAAWYDEIAYTDGTPESCDDKNPGAEEAICHYTQVVWKDSKKLGCAKGKATVAGYENGDYWVCQYGPGGNYGGRFSKNVLAPTKSKEECQQQQPTPAPTPSSHGDIVEETHDPDCADGDATANPRITWSDGSLASCEDLDWFCEYAFVAAKCKKTCNAC